MKTLWIVLILGAAYIPAAFADPAFSTDDPLWDAKHAAQWRWRTRLAELLAARTRDPDHVALIALQREMQQGRILMRSHRYACLLRHDPRRLVTDAGYGAWSNFV